MKKIWGFAVCAALGLWACETSDVSKNGRSAYTAADFEGVENVSTPPDCQIVFVGKAKIAPECLFTPEDAKLAQQVVGNFYAPYFEYFWAIGDEGRVDHGISDYEFKRIDDPNTGHMGDMKFSSAEIDFPSIDRIHNRSVENRDRQIEDTSTPKFDASLAYVESRAEASENFVAQAKAHGDDVRLKFFPGNDTSPRYVIGTPIKRGQDGALLCVAESFINENFNNGEGSGQKSDLDLLTAPCFAIAELRKTNGQWKIWDLNAVDIEVVGNRVVGYTK